MMAGCIPARTPAQLDHTPEPSVIVMDGMVDNGLFRVRPPEGWEIVTGMESGAVIVFSQGKAWIMLSTDRIETPQPDGDAQTDTTHVTLSSGQIVTGLLHAPRENFDTVKPIFEQVMASIHPA